MKYDELIECEPGDWFEGGEAPTATGGAPTCLSRGASKG